MEESNPRPLISIIVPVYNVEPYLAACLDSIISQSYSRLEIIVINDGSTDFSLSIAEKYADSDDRIKVFSYENSGLSAARNHGLEVATGDFVSFVDSDDTLLPRAIETLLHYALAFDAELVEGAVIRDKVIGKYEKVKKPVVLAYSPAEAIADVLYQSRLLPSVCGKLYRSRIFDNLRFQTSILYEDLDIICKIFDRCHKIVWINFPVYFYRITEGSIIDTWKSARLDVLKVTKDIENYITEKYPEILGAAHDRRLSANFNMFALCEIHGDRENADRCWQHIKQRRQRSLFNRRVRFKNKAGILLSYLGRPLFRMASRLVYK